MDYQVSQHQPQQLNDLSNDSEPMTNTNLLMNTDLLAYTMDKLAKSMDIQHIDPHSVMYLALATQHRLETYLRHMIEASQHRIHSQSSEQHKVTQVQDIRKQLLAMERVDREEERRRRQALADREHNANQDNAHHDDTTMDDDDDDGTKKKKKKKKDLGPGAAARNMSEDVYKQATNKTALMLAGGIRKSWMLAGSTAATTTSKSLPPPPTPPTTQVSSSDATSTTTLSNRGRPKGRKSETNKRPRKRNDGGMVLPPSTIGRQPSGRGELDLPIRKVTLVDAMHALEQELDSGCEAGNRALIRSYNQYLK